MMVTDAKRAAFSRSGVPSWASLCSRASISSNGRVGIESRVKEEAVPKAINGATARCTTGSALAGGHAITVVCIAAAASHCVATKEIAIRHYQQGTDIAKNRATAAVGRARARGATR